MMRLVTRSASRHARCPSCGSRGGHALSDGRRQCRRCRRKYTPARARGRLRTNLPAATVAEVARLFWLLVPAAAAARDLGLDRKTTTRLYDRLRRAIAARADREAARGRAKIHGSVEVDESYFGGHRKGKRGRGAAGKVAVFGLLKRRGGQVRVVFPDRLDRATLQGAIVANVRPASWVYSDGLHAYDKLHLAGFRHKRVDHGATMGSGRTHINGIENFWGFAKRRLKMYHGGWKRNFRLFIREMEFRFNHRRDSTVVMTLAQMLKVGPV
jgi:transposase